MSRILIVDDIKDNITLLTFDLEDDGHDIITAQNGEECLSVARQELPDLILRWMAKPETVQRRSPQVSTSLSSFS